MVNGEVTQILSHIQNGDRQAASQLLPLVYVELRRLASQKMLRERSSHTLQPTALVHEAFLRLVGDQSAQSWDCRAHFFAAAAEAMRRILIEFARRRKTEKRGGDRQRLELSVQIAVDEWESSESLLALDEALTRLASEDAELARLVELRYFAGMTIDQTAELLDVSPRTVKRNWAYARAWLRREMEA